MGRTIGYARVSTTDQDLTVQRAALEAAGCSIVLEEKITGTTRDGRGQLDLAMKLLTKGDVLTVTRLDRLGRSLRDLSNITHELQEKGAALRVLEQSVDTSTSAGRAFFGMLATFAQFETDVRRERQAEGIRRAKGGKEKRKDGKTLKYAGRAPTARAKAAEVLALHKDQRGPSYIAKALGISRMSVHRILKATTEKAAV
jgi:DNA invertase Pin-like site-specific DNA recombinase